MQTCKTIRKIFPAVGTPDDGADVVSGWRKNRQDAAVRRTFVSRVANRIISAVSGVKLNDYGCTLKAYRRDVLKGVRLYGEMHRFVPIYASWMGPRLLSNPCVIMRAALVPQSTAWSGP